MRVPSLLVTVAAAPAIAGCNSKATDEAPAATPVRVAAATSGSGGAIDPHQRTAREQGRDPARVQGRRRHPQARVSEGEHVRKGQKLAEIEQTEVNAQVEQARQANEKAKRDAARGERLYEDKVISLEQLQDLRTQAAMAEAALNSAEFNWNYAAIVAPRDGTVLRRLAEERELVSAGTPVLVLGAQDKGFVVRTGSGGSRDRAGAPRRCCAQIRLDALPDATLDGKVTEVASAADAAQRHVPHRSDARPDRPAAEERPGREADGRAVVGERGLARLRADRRDRRRRRPHGAPVRARPRTTRAGATSKSPSSKATTLRWSAASKQASKSSPTARSISRTARRWRSLNRLPPSRTCAPERRGEAAMSLLEFPIRRYQFTLIAFAMLVALGITAFRSIPRQEDPYFPIATFQIVIAYPGAEPQDVERLVVKPIEDRLSELDDVKKIESYSNDGVAVIIAGVLLRRGQREEVRRGRARGQRAAPDAAAGADEGRDPQVQSRARQHRAVRAGVAGRALSRARRLRARPERHAQDAGRRAHRRKPGRIRRASCASRSTCRAWRS